MSANPYSIFNSYQAFWGEYFHHLNNLSDIAFFLFFQLPFLPFPTYQCSDPSGLRLVLNISISSFMHSPVSGSPVETRCLLQRGLWSYLSWVRVFIPSLTCKLESVAFSSCFRHDLWMLLSAFLVDHYGFRRMSGKICI